jgi:hypothetical protein
MNIPFQANETVPEKHYIIDEERRANRVGVR